MGKNFEGKKIAEGSNSVILLVENEKTADFSIVKKLKDKQNHFPYSEQIKNEYEVLNGIDIENVRKVKSIKNIDSAPILELEYFDGITLKQALKSGFYSFSLKLDIAIEICKTLADIHSNEIVHCDFNPYNILINDDRNIAVVDFGSASKFHVGDPTKKVSEFNEGTLPYISPEQTGRTNHPIDHRTDLYSFGIMLYEMFTNALPFEHEEPLEIFHAHLAIVPTPLNEKNQSLPSVVSDIVLKLLAKNVDQRYQSARGLLADLKKCRKSLIENIDIPLFETGKNDVPVKLILSNKLYGRDASMDIIKSAIKNCSLKKKVVFTEGSAGTGKSTLIEEATRPFLLKKSFLLYGKHEEYFSDTPFFGIGQAIHSFVDFILSEKESVLNNWKSIILNTIGNEGKIMTDLFPSLELIIGQQPELSPLGINEAQNRLIYVFLKFFKGITSTERSIILFIDDLQWSDYASTQLLEKLILDPDIKNITLLCAYRGNDLPPLHPLTDAIKAIADAAVDFERIKLKDISIQNTQSLINDTFKTTESESNQLTKIVFDKTGGNPFFLNQFLRSMYEQRFIFFNFFKTDEVNSIGKWDWKVAEMEKMDFTDNVVEFIILKLKNLPAQTIEIITVASCFGIKFNSYDLGILCNKETEELEQLLQAVIEEQFIIEIGIDSDERDLDQGPTKEYKFAHDRVREAAYESLDAEQKSTTHKHIGKNILLNSKTESYREELFDIVHHLNLGAEHIKSDVEIKQLSMLNYKAGLRARISSAYNAAFNFFQRSKDCLGEKYWEEDYYLMYDVHLRYIEAAHLIGQLDLMKSTGDQMIEHCESITDKVKVENVYIYAYLAAHKHDEVITIGIDILQNLGIKIPANPNKFNVITELLKTKFIVGKKQISFFKDLNFTEEEKLNLAINTLSSLSTAGYHNAPELFPITIFKSIQLAVKHGNSIQLISFYGGYGTILCAVTGEIEKGFEFGELSLDLLKSTPDAKQIKSKTQVIFSGFINHWKRHLKESIPMLKESYFTAMETGDPQYAASSLFIHAYHSFLLGEDLNHSIPKIKEFHEKIDQMGQVTYALYSKISLQRTINVFQDNGSSAQLEGPYFSEKEYFEGLENGTYKKDKTALFHIYYGKVFLGFLFGSHKLAFDNIANLQNHLDIALSTAFIPSFHYLRSLIGISYWPSASKQQKSKIKQWYKTDLKKLKNWSAHSPENFEHKRLTLLGIYNSIVLENNEAACNFYKKAILLASENGYTNEHAIALELFARHHEKEADEEQHTYYLKKAYEAYKMWGAGAKVAAFEKEYADILLEQFEFSNAKTFSTLSAGSSLLDLTTILKSSSTISSEIKLEKVIDNLLKIVVENAGAENGLFLLNNNDELKLAASNTINNKVRIINSGEVLKQNIVPLSIIQYTKRSKENIVIESAHADSKYARDPYIKQNKTESILCIPIVLHNKLLGVIYLENNLVKGAFTVERLELIKLLSGQMAITLNNAILYDNMELKIKERTQEIEIQKEELRKRNEALKVINQEKDDLINVVSHDLRSPLNQVKGLAELTAMTSQDKSVTEYTDKMIEATNYLNGMITRILDISTIDTQKIELKIEQLDIIEVLHTIISNYSNVTAPKGIQVNLHSMHNGLNFQMDKHYFIQIIDNLLSNAIKFSYENSKIDIFIEKENTDVQIEIKDYGPGISPEDQGKLFNKFQKLSAKPTGNESSTGLGLSIVKKYAEALQGEISVKSNLNEGTSFVLILPNLKKN